MGPNNVESTREAYLDKVNNQMPESVYTANCGVDPMVSVLLNGSSAVDPSNTRPVPRWSICGF